MINIHVDPILGITEQNQTELLMHRLKMLNNKYKFISIIIKTTKIHNKHFSPSLAQHGLCLPTKATGFLLYTCICRQATQTSIRHCVSGLSQLKKGSLV